MSYKPHQQILTFFDLLNHLNTFYYSYAPVRVFLRTGAFCMLKKIFEKISENIWHFFKAPYYPAKRGSTTNFQQERR